MWRTEYKQKETGTKQLVGKVATELSSLNYGPVEWWLLLEPVPQRGPLEPAFWREPSVWCFV